jgi:hypothetical protein
MVTAAATAMISVAKHFERSKPDAIPRESNEEKEFKASLLKRAGTGAAHALLFETDSQSIA